MRWILVAVALLFIAGCGDIQWFPNSTGTSTTDASAPDAFTIPAKTISMASAVTTKTIESDHITISGNNPSGWLMTVADDPAATNSEIFVDYKDGTFGSFIRAGGILEGPITLHSGDTFYITQIPSTDSTKPVVSTVITIGTYTTAFKTTTQ